MSNERELRNSKVAKPVGVLKEIDVGGEGEHGQGWCKDLGSGNQKEAPAFSSIEYCCQV